MILLIDNYDSFTFNLFQMIEASGVKCRVVRNDQISLEEIAELRPEKIVISPGPGTPDNAGITLSVIEQFAQSIPLFGVCLGHQAIGQAFGGKVVKAKRALHGKRSKITHDGQGIFQGLSASLMVTRYHSLVLERKSLPHCLIVTSETEDGTIMGLRHRNLPIECVQFHPESFATENGAHLMAALVRGLEKQ